MIKFENIKTEDKYRVVKNRETFFGKCEDLIALEGQKITVIEKNPLKKYIKIRSEFETTHVCFAENLELIEEKKDVKKSVNNVEYYEFLPTLIATITKDGSGEIVSTGTITQSYENQKVIRNGNATIVILEDGSKGVALCKPEDKYSPEDGYEIAALRAEIECCKKKLNALCHKKRNKK